MCVCSVYPLNLGFVETCLFTLHGYFYGDLANLKLQLTVTFEGLATIVQKCTVVQCTSSILLKTITLDFLGD